MLVRAALATLAVALFALLASALLWPAAGARRDDALRAADPESLVSAFENASQPLATVDVGTIYAGHDELLDPRTVLPTWHLHPRTEAARVFEATRTCPPRSLAEPFADGALAKAYAWHERTCNGGPPTQALVEAPPLMHPSGKSYAAIARAPTDWKKLHVLELAESDAPDEERRALASLGSREWLGLSRGDRMLLTKDRFVTAKRGSLGLVQLRFFERAAWEQRRPELQTGALLLVPRSTLPCARTASSLLCWESAADRRAIVWQRGVSTAAAALAIASVIALGFAFVRERRRAALDRLHLLRTLTHELRTPAMALALDIEPLRAGYDDLPAHLQEPFLKVSGGIARLRRVLHHGARALELFEGKGKLAAPITIESAREMLQDLAAEWPESVTLEWIGEDGAIATDPEWLAVAVRNLVENACKHGKPPALVRARLDEGTLVVRVEDAGETPKLTHARQRGGLGLGLALAARIAEALGGTLDHEPRPTAFVLRIPGKVGT